jgi:hypothetical protein
VVGCIVLSWVSWWVVGCFVLWWVMGCVVLIGFFGLLWVSFGLSYVYCLSTWGRLTLSLINSSYLSKKKKLKLSNLQVVRELRKEENILHTQSQYTFF